MSDGVLSLACEPQSLMLDIAGGASFGIFEGLHAVLAEIVSDPRCKTDENGRVVLELLGLKLNSLTHHDHRLIILLFRGPSNARSFIWTGPDPPHHFSTAIVPPAVTPLFTALSSYTLLTHLQLTNIAFPDPVVTPDARWIGIPCIPSLRSLYLGQVTFLPAEHVADFILRCTTGESSSSNSASALERVQLVDVYEESIWGPRLKKPRILSASTTILMESGLSQDFLGPRVLELIERLISVDAKTERIVGGDRVIPELLFPV
ncbi:hypothetical protein BT96DRAFT_925766 [Gymnopus androsaceus JB14]|uniref:Uncharacterized protein n=1 Tax=Gymnopus androsaceus JB14 TaxID=1447944 RepID=A0A6A4H0C9_9AGAR|nr:hypothetical protein BT96DRAFT_925766 [Gymnopus androsaceus JB14]